MNKNTYFKRFAYPDRLLDKPPRADTDIIITIPSYNEPGLSKTLSSLNSCLLPDCTVEVLVLENYPENKPPELFYHLPDTLGNSTISFQLLTMPLPSRKAGVGMARKIIMDEAARRLTSINKPGGLIVALDADCTVQPNYLLALYQFYSSGKAPAASIYYEHPTEGNEPDEVYEAAMEYELHLRYYVHAQRWAGARYAYQTVGSAMVTRNATYQAVGGMNTRKAGEDFYFLQKIMPHGFAEIRNTCVYPSPRISDRVPFGTGRAVAERISNGQERKTYAPESFRILRELYDQRTKIYEGHKPTLHPHLEEFLLRVSAREEFLRMRTISNDYSTFEKHFHTWFDGFQLMKCLHFLRDSGHTDRSLSDSANWLLGNQATTSPPDLPELLNHFRKLDKGII